MEQDALFIFTRAGLIAIGESKLFLIYRRPLQAN
jgi:hypothetical protein